MDAKKIATGAIGVVALFYSVRAALFFLGVDAALHFDEGYIATFGERMLDGRFLPYVDAVSQRGPVLYWLASIAQWVGGRFEWTGIRHLAFLCFVLASLGVLLAGVAARQAFVGAVASLLFVVTMVAVLSTAGTLDRAPAGLFPGGATRLASAYSWLCNHGDRSMQRLWSFSRGGASWLAEGARSGPMGRRPARACLRSDRRVHARGRAHLHLGFR